MLRRVVLKMMWIVAFILAASVGHIASQEDWTRPEVLPETCCYLTGIWVNEKGSKLIINHTRDGVLTGSFKTAVETHVGASGGEQTLHGKAGSSIPTTFGFTVNFKDGMSTTAWSGLYHVCDNQETLKTTWLLTSLTKDCQDAWQATRVGQDTFVRVEDSHFPEFQRKKNYAHKFGKKFWKKMSKMERKRAKSDAKLLRKINRSRKHHGKGGRKDN